MKLARFFRAALYGIASMFYAKRCIGCDKLIKEDYLCSECRESFFTEAVSGCQGCGRAFPFCRCAIDFLNGSELIYALPYKGENSVTREMILFFKERKHREITEELAERTKAALLANGEFDGFLLTFIPRSRMRKVHTGVDQTKELAILLSQKTSLPLVNTIHCRETHKQQKLLGINERKNHANIRFRLRNGANEIIKGKKIVLLDDVVTSGASVKRCAELLYEGGAAEVVCIAAARSVKYL